MPEYVIYELCLLALAGVVARRTLGPDPGLADQLCLTFCLKLLASSVLPFLTTMARINAPTTYWVIMLLALAGAFALGRRVWRPRFVLPKGGALAEFGAAGLVIAYCAIVAIGRTGPVAETDSLVNFSYVIEWAHNAASPYLMAYDYSSLWEMNFVPAVVFRASDAVLWWPAAEAILLLGVTLYLLASRMVGDRWLVWLVVAAVLTLPAFIVVSGYGTLKNDPIYSAGALLLVLSLVQRRDGRPATTAILMLSGLTFLSVKFSGPAYAACLLLGALLIAWWRDRASLGREIRFMALVGLGALVLGGHYYVKNILLFHNPLFPYPLKLGPVALPGFYGLPTTSLLHRLKEPAIWADFLHSPVYGLAGVACVGLGLVMGLLLLIRPGRPDDRAPDILLMGACVLGWLVYFGSIYSDLLGPALVSVRYVTAAVAMSFVLLARGGRSLGPVGAVVVGVFLGWCAVSQGWAVFNNSYRYDPHPTVMALARHAAPAAILAVAVGLAAANARPAAIVLAAGACLLLGARVAEINRMRWWLPDWSPVINHVSRFRSGEALYLVTAFPDLHPLPSSAPSRYLSLAQVLYPAVGPNFKNHVDYGDVDKLARLLRSGRRYNGIVIEGWVPLDPAIIDELTRAVTPFGYAAVEKGNVAAFYAPQRNR